MDAGRSLGLHELRRQGPTLILILAVASLTLLGFIILFSATQAHTGGPQTIVRKQAVWLTLALLACGFTAFLNMDFLRPLAWPLAGLVGGLLLLVLVPGVGVTVNGARRWLDLGPMNMQVSDFAKISMIFLLAHYLAANQRYLDSFFKGFFIPFCIVGTFFVLVMAEPDFGTAFLLGLVGCTMLFLAGVRLLYLMPSLAAGGALFAVAIFLDPVRMRRITAFLDVEAHKSDGAYQLWQGILAFGAGGMNGVGLGNGRQQNSFLPEAHTDFIFPIIGEELGLLFSGGAVALFLLIFVLSLVKLRRAPNMFQFLFAAGAILLITSQALINIGVTTGCLPTKGMSLPFISYGGSGLVTMFILTGILINCFRMTNRCPLPNPITL